jgi:hypothetical protein
MASSRSKGPGGVPWTVIIPVAHAAVDLATSAHCHRLWQSGRAVHLFQLQETGLA